MVTQEATLRFPIAPVVRVEQAPSDERFSIFTSDELLAGKREAWIEHNGEMYRLRLTGSGKLYLTK